MQFEQEITAIRQELARAYGISGRSLRAQVRRIGRLLPRYERGQARKLVQAESALAHPKLAQTIDAKAFNHATTTLRMHLEGVDPADRLKGRVLGILGGLVVNLALALAAILGFLYWRGVF